MPALYGPWDYSTAEEQFPYDNTATYRLAGRFVSGHGLVEDWGCGVGWAKRYIEAPYRGIDGAASKWTDVVADLRTYRSNVPCIFMRHVLEHNPDWRAILENLVASFQKKAALITFIPFSPDDDVYLSDDTWPVPDISLSRRDFDAIIAAGGAAYWTQHLETQTQRGAEDIFYLVKEPAE